MGASKLLINKMKSHILSSVKEFQNIFPYKLKYNKEEYEFPMHWNFGEWDSENDEWINILIDEISENIHTNAEDNPTFSQ